MIFKLLVCEHFKLKYSFCQSFKQVLGLSLTDLDSFWSWLTGQTGYLWKQIGWHWLGSHRQSLFSSNWNQKRLHNIWRFTFELIELGSFFFWTVKSLLQWSNIWRSPLRTRIQLDQFKRNTNCHFIIFSFCGLFLVLFLQSISADWVIVQVPPPVLA